MKRVLCIAFAFFFLLSTIAVAEITPYSNEIREASCTLTRNGNTLKATACLRTRSTADELKISSFSIQEYQNGQWRGVTSLGSVTKNNSCYLSKTLTYTGKTDCKYRAVAKFSATVDGVTETVTRISSTK